MGVNRTQDQNEVVLERLDGMFCCIGTLLIGWYLLEDIVVLQKSILDFLIALVVKDVQCG